MLRRRAAPKGRREDDQRSGGFTLIELLVVVAIIGIIAAIGIPSLRRAMLKGKIARLTNDATALYKAFTTYNIDESFYPPTVDLDTLEPLVSLGHLRTSASVLGTLKSKKVTEYDSPDVQSVDTEFYAVMTLAAHPAVRVVIGDTENFPEAPGEKLMGSYFIFNGTLLPIDEDILKLLGL